MVYNFATVVYSDIPQLEALMSPTQSVTYIHIYIYIYIYVVIVSGVGGSKKLSGLITYSYPPVHRVDN